MGSYINPRNSKYRRKYCVKLTQNVHHSRVLSVCDGSTWTDSPAAFAEVGSWPNYILQCGDIFPPP